MTDRFLGEIRLMSFASPPKGWAICNGQVLPINSYQSLYSLLGTKYGGDGRTTFALPDMRGRVAVAAGNGFDQGEMGGESTHTLTVAQIPEHRHKAYAVSDEGSVPVGAGGYMGAFNNGYGDAAGMVQMQGSSIGMTGLSQGHDNMSPFTVLNYMIALTGLFPSRQ